MTGPSTVVVYTRAAVGVSVAAIVTGLGERLRLAGHRVIIVPNSAALPPGVPAPTTFDLPVGLGHADAVVAVAQAASGSLLDQVADAGVPLVLVDQGSERMDLPVVRPDDAGATHLAVAHLVEHGHTRIGFAGATRHPEVRRRYAAYHAAVVQRGLLPNPDDEFLVAEPGAEGGRRAARLIAAMPDRPTAVVVASDAVAIGLLEGLAEGGIAVPEDLAVVSFENTDRGAFTPVPLTSVDLRPHQIGERAARLVRRALGGDRLRPGVRVARSAVLVTRRSCGCGTGVPGEVEETGGRLPADADLPAGLWFRRAGQNLDRALGAERTLADQQRVFAAIFGDQDASRLGWLAGSRIHGAALALWRDRAAETLTIVGWHGDAAPNTGRAALGSSTSARTFPPRELMAATEGGTDRVCLVVPVATAQREWGLFALVWDHAESPAVDVIRHWATLLAIALDREEMASSVRRREARYAAASQAVNDGLWEYRRSDGSLYTSERTRELLGALPGSVVTPEWWLERAHPDDRNALRAMLSESVRRPSAPIALEYRVGSAEEGYRWMMSRGLGILGPDGRLDRVVGSLSDIDRRRSLEERLRYSALHDALTGLANRIQLNDRVAGALAAWSAQEVASIGVIFLDLDDFKAVNDRFGHLAGDELLREVGRRLDKAVRDGDTAARFGGDEFAVLVLDSTDQELLGVAERIRDSIAEPIELAGELVLVTASIGVATSPGPDARPQDLLHAADIAMYRAKASGRGQVCVVDGAGGWLRGEVPDLAGGNGHLPAPDPDGAVHSSGPVSHRAERDEPDVAASVT